MGEKPHGVALAAHQADVDLGQTEIAELGGDQDVARCRDRQASAERRAVDGCHHRFGALPDGVVGLPGGAAGAPVVAWLWAATDSLLDVRARTEDRALAGQDNGPDLVEIAQPVEHGGDISEHLRRVGVHRRVVEPDECDVVLDNLACDGFQVDVGHGPSFSDSQPIAVVQVGETSISPPTL